jgi:hypothetical protein
MADDTLDTSPAPAGGELSGRISSWRDFEDRVGAAMAVAATQASNLTLVDADFARWPIGRRSVMAAFQQWALASKVGHCTLLGGSFENFARVHPLWVAWQRNWLHRVRCHQAPDEFKAALAPMLVLHGKLGLRLNEPLHGSGVWTRDTVTLASWLQEVDVILQRSPEAMPATTLGL